MIKIYLNYYIFCSETLIQVLCTYYDWCLKRFVNVLLNLLLGISYKLNLYSFPNENATASLSNAALHAPTTKLVIVFWSVDIGRLLLTPSCIQRIELSTYRTVARHRILFIINWCISYKCTYFIIIFFFYYTQKHYG